MSTHPSRPRSLLECDGPYALSAMPVQAKALTSARCHLERDHGLDVAELAGQAATGLMKLHFLAHDFDPVPSYPPEWLPWQIRSLPHRMLEKQGQEQPHR